MNEAEQTLTGAKILTAEVDGYGIQLELDNGKVFVYDASDGGYSCWEIEEERC